MSAIEFPEEDHESPLDLPVFGGSGVGQGRVRSAFRYGRGDADDIEPPVASLDKARQIRQRAEQVDPDQVDHAQPAAPANPMDWELVAQLRAEVSRRLSDRMGDAQWSVERREDEGRDLIGALLDERAAEALARRAEADSLAQQEALAKAVFDAVFGLGRLQPLVDDERAENILISGCDRVIVEHADGTLWPGDAVAETDKELEEFIAFLAERSPNPRSFTRSQPSLNLTLPDGSRLAAALDTARISVVIRRHRIRQVTLAELVEWGSITETMADFLQAAVRAGLSIVVAGGQGAGKTTFLRARAPPSIPLRCWALSSPSTNSSCTRCPSSTTWCFRGRRGRVPASVAPTAARPARVPPLSRSAAPSGSGWIGRSWAKSSARKCGRWSS